MNLPDYFKEVNDFRVKGRCLHPLSDILGLVLCGVLCDCDDFSEIEDFGIDRLCFLREELGFVFPNGIPSEDTMDRVFRYLSAEEMEKAFSHCLSGIKLSGKHLSIDGKELRGTIPQGKRHAKVQMVNVWLNESSLSFGQLQVEEKSNEITAIPQLLDQIECKGSIVTIDAIGAQKAITEKVLERGADFVIALKANQGTLFQQVSDFMEKRKERLPVYRSLDKGHGRGEERKVYVAQEFDLVEEVEKWMGIHSLVMVERTRFTAKGEKRQVQFYISSLKRPSPEEASGYVRGHWGIENRLHWQLDFTFREDGNRVRKENGPSNLHQCRKWALYLFQKEPTKISVKRKRKKAARDKEFLKAVINA